MEKYNPVVIIGAGVAGLTCATYLARAGVPFVVLEASDSVGGRVRTDLVEGFRLDRGFQILLTAYPEAQRLLSYPALKLGAFESGALIRQPDGFIEMSDPFKYPSRLFQALTAPVGSLSDKLGILRLLADVNAVAKADDFFTEMDTDTLSYLQDFGWSDEMIYRFFSPFFGGVFLENELSTSSNFFRFVFKQFYNGEAVLPAQGMQAIPEQLLAGLPAGAVRLNTPVRAVESARVLLESGEWLEASQVVLATDTTRADRLLGRATEQRAFNMTTCTYFSADRDPLPRNMLAINPNRLSPVHHVCVPSSICPSYAPEGQSLISVSTQGVVLTDPAKLALDIRLVLREWFGEEVENWRHLRTYHIPEALASFEAGSRKQPLRLGERLYCCGDYLAYPSLNAAMQTGREVAEQLIAVV